VNLREREERGVKKTKKRKKPSAVESEIEKNGSMEKQLI
jgi:hypothetical protein